MRRSGPWLTVLAVALAAIEHTVLAAALAPLAAGTREPESSPRSGGCEFSRTPLLFIGNQTITLDGDDIGVTTSEIKDSSDDQIAVLSVELAALRLDGEASFRPSLAEPEWPARIILQADGTVPSEVLNKVIATLRLANWRNISFAIEETSAPAPFQGAKEPQ